MVKNNILLSSKYDELAERLGEHIRKENRQNEAMDAFEKDMIEGVNRHNRKRTIEIEADQREAARREALIRKAEENWKRAVLAENRQQAFYLHIAYCVIAGAIATILCAIGAVAFPLAMIVIIGALAWVGLQFYWIIRRAIHLYKKENQRRQPAPCILRKEG